MLTPRSLWQMAGDPPAVVDAVSGKAGFLALPSDPAQAEGMRPLRAGPLPGSASLFLDGWSTWASAPAPELGGSDFTITAWFAPRSLVVSGGAPMAPVVDARDGQGGLALGHDGSGRLAAMVGEADAPLIVAPGRLRLGQWNHVALSVDGLGGRAVLFHDGLPVAEADFSPRGLRFAETLLFGRSSNPGSVGGLIATGTVAGLLAEVGVFEGTLPSVPCALDVARPLDEDMLAPARARFARDPARPIFHLMPSHGWMNEPHGAIQVDGRHHVFFQHNPAGPYWGRISWGHMVSEDLVHWRELPPALEPASDSVAPDGAWSGSSVLDGDGSHLLYFTAGNLDRVPNQSVAVARPAGGRWGAGAVVVEQPPRSPSIDEPVLRGEFRDPFVWRDDRRWYMLVGSGFEGRGGAALLFTSDDGNRWMQREPLLVGDEARFPRTGLMWELPVLLPVGPEVGGVRRSVLLVAPWWPGPSPHHLQYVWYWLGTWEAESCRFTPDQDEPLHFDVGGGLTGPSGTVTADGRSILWTIAQDERSLEEHALAGWAHNAGLPLELGLHDDGTLKVRPVAELARLRQRALLQLRGVDGEAAQASLADLRLPHGELYLEAELDGGQADVMVRVSPDAAEQTVVSVDAGGGRLVLDRSRSSLDQTHCEPPRDGPLPHSPVTRVRIFVDGSMVEAYVDDRLTATTRAYPTRADATGVAIRLPARARVLRLEVYELHSAYDALEGSKS